MVYVKLRGVWLPSLIGDDAGAKNRSDRLVFESSRPWSCQFETIVSIFSLSWLFLR